MDDLVCELCWQRFDSTAELEEHRACEGNTLYVLDGENVVVDIDTQEPST